MPTGQRGRQTHLYIMCIYTFIFMYLNVDTMKIHLVSIHNHLIIIYIRCSTFSTFDDKNNQAPSLLPLFRVHLSSIGPYFITLLLCLFSYLCFLLIIILHLPTPPTTTYHHPPPMINMLKNRVVNKVLF